MILVTEFQFIWGRKAEKKVSFDINIDLASSSDVNVGF